MKNLILLLFAFLLMSCTAFKNSQNQDDVYYSRKDNIVKNDTVYVETEEPIIEEPQQTINFFHNL